jgi:hypothetical protein
MSTYAKYKHIKNTVAMQTAQKLHYNALTGIKEDADSKFDLKSDFLLQSRLKKESFDCIANVLNYITPIVSICHNYLFTKIDYFVKTIDKDVYKIKRSKYLLAWKGKYTHGYINSWDKKLLIWPNPKYAHYIGFQSIYQLNLNPKETLEMSETIYSYQSHFNPEIDYAPNFYFQNEKLKYQLSKDFKSGLSSSTSIDFTYHHNNNPYNIENKIEITMTSLSELRQKTKDEYKKYYFDNRRNIVYSNENLPDGIVLHEKCDDNDDDDHIYNLCVNTKVLSFNHKPIYRIDKNHITDFIEEIQYCMGIWINILRTGIN